MNTKKASATLCRTGFLFNEYELTERFNEKILRSVSHYIIS
ncbi:hypothetical protein [Vibrio tasmaniensis]|nr:hypothetical protein [Vibrio tasmaniensis]